MPVVDEYTCASCEKVVNETPCPFCQSSVGGPPTGGKPLTAPLSDITRKHASDISSRPVEPPRPKLVASPPPKTTPPKETPKPTSSTQPRKPPLVTVPREEPPRGGPPNSPPTATETINVAGLSAFKELLEHGYRAIVICGRAKSGKSEIVDGFRRANIAFRGKINVRGKKSDQASLITVAGTEQGEVWYEVPNTDRHIVFLDPSGEFFRRIDPNEKYATAISEKHFDFVRDAVKRLAGILLVLDISEPDNELLRESSPWRVQENTLDFTLATLRWLRFDGKARFQALGLVETIAARVKKLRRLNVPVLVLLSKADLVRDYTRQNPLEFVREQLPVLHAALLTHARRFHVDFCETMERGDEGDRQAARPCGVLLSLEWLIDSPLRRLPRIAGGNWLMGGGR